MTDQTPNPTPTDIYLAADTEVDAAALLRATHARDFDLADDILRNAAQPVQLCRTLTQWALAGIANTCGGDAEKMAGYIEALAEDLVGRRDAAHAAVMAEETEGGQDE